MNNRVPIVKAGWMLRRSAFLRRWKNSWCVLYADREFRCFESQTETEPEERLRLRPTSEVREGLECDLEVPEGASAEAAVTVEEEGTTIYLCAESKDDAFAWAMMFKQIRFPPPPPRNQRPPSAPPGGAYAQGATVPPPMYRGSDGRLVYPQNVTYYPDGTTVVHVGNGTPYRYRRACCDGNDAALGFATGAVAGSLLLTPFLWGPFFWC